jgi:GNAT superfamily N-acetyltransferase
MRFTIRPLRVPDEFPRVVELTNAYRAANLTVAELAENDRKAPPGSIWHRLVAVDPAGYVAAYAFVRHMPYENPGQFVTRVLVDSRSQGQGMGGALQADTERFAREQGAIRLDSDVRDNDPAGLAWAQRRGFAILDHVFESTLDPATFDETPFRPVLEGLEAEGIRFVTLDRLSEPEREQKLYALETACAPDNPLYDLQQPLPFADWRRFTLERPSMPASQFIIALDGNRFIGDTCMNRNVTDGSFYTDFTCVHREYRGRGVALALKVLAVRMAKAAGSPYMRTNNDSRNGPMLAVNRKLGYTPVPGFYGLRKELAAAAEGGD